MKGYRFQSLEQQGAICDNKKALPMQQFGPFESHYCTLRKRLARGGIHIFLWYLCSINKERSSFTKYTTDIRFSDREDWYVVGFDVRQK